MGASKFMRIIGNREGTVAQQADAAASKAEKCGFKSHPCHQMPEDAPPVEAGRRQNAIDQPERCKQSGKPIRSAAAATGQANGTSRA